MTINVSQLGTKAKSKNEMYKILTWKLIFIYLLRKNVLYTLLERYILRQKEGRY